MRCLVSIYCTHGNDDYVYGSVKTDVVNSVSSGLTWSINVIVYDEEKEEGDNDEDDDDEEEEEIDE